MIFFECPECESVLRGRIPGDLGKCPICDHWAEVPEPTEPTEEEIDLLCHTFN